MAEYILVGRDGTSGWDSARNSVNAPNSFGMRPIEVAAQAADVREFKEIYGHPDFDPSGVDPYRFVEVGRMQRDYMTGAEERYTEIKEALRGFNERFPYDATAGQRVKRADQTNEKAIAPTLADDDSPASRSAKQRFLNEHAADARLGTTVWESQSRPAAPRMRG
jgi:hypothetical protein